MYIGPFIFKTNKQNAGQIAGTRSKPRADLRRYYQMCHNQNSLLHLHSLSLYSCCVSAYPESDSEAEERQEKGG